MNARDLIAGVRRNLWLVVSLVLLGAASGAALALFQTKQYKTSTTVFVSMSQGQSSIDQRYQATLFAQERVRSYAALVATPTVTQPVVRALGLPLTPDELAERVETDIPVGTVMLNITARYEDAATAAKIANSVTQRLIAVVTELETPEGGRSSMVHMQVVRPAAVPDTPSSPQPLIDVVLGFVLGTVAGVGAGVLREALDTRVHRAADLAKLIKSPILANVPKDPEAQTTPVVGDQFGPRAEAYRKLRTAVRFVDVDAPVRVLLVSSPLMGDGKSTTAINLAASLAADGAGVVLVDADLRRPVLAQTLGLVGEAGLTTVLTGRAIVEDVIQSTGGPGGVAVLTSGPLPPNPSELLGTKRMRDLLERLAEGYDYVIIDTPPLLPVTDAAVLAPHVDAVVLVMRAKKTRRDEAREAVSVIETAKARLAGVVFNCGEPAAADRYGPYVQRPGAGQAGRRVPG